MNFLLFSWLYSDCEIVGWGMQEYNNTDSYPDSVRAASIQGKLIIIINEKLSKLIHQLKSVVYFWQRCNFDRNVAKNTTTKIVKNMTVLLLVVEMAAHRNEKLCKKEKGRSTQLDWKIKTF